MPTRSLQPRPEPAGFPRRVLDALVAWDTPPRRDVPELIDDDTQPYADFRASMSDVRRVNRFLGGTAAVIGQAKHWLLSAKRRNASQNAPVGTSPAPLRFLDVATGSADIPAALLQLAQRLNVPVEIVGLDYSPPILRYAREEAGHLSGLRLVRGDAFRLPFADNSFDYALCSLAFHHWGLEGSIAALREMERVTRRGWLVNDLRRASSAWHLIRFVMRFAHVNRLTRHDAPASVLRAYSLDEYASMPRALNLLIERDVQIRRSLFYRVALIREKR